MEDRKKKLRIGIMCFRDGRFVDGFGGDSRAAFVHRVEWSGWLIKTTLGLKAMIWGDLNNIKNIKYKKFQCKYFK